MLVDLMTEQYYTLNETGGRVWRLIADGEPLASVVTEIARMYEVDETQCRADVSSLVEKLRNWGLLA
jgi:hypothetical protein